MIHRTVHRRAARRILTTLSVTVLVATGIGYAARAEALPDPYTPVPPFWCPGNGPGLTSTGFASYCEGRSFPDGTRLNTYRIGAWWQPVRCIIPNGTIDPPLAGPGGCAGVLG